MNISNSRRCATSAIANCPSPAPRCRLTHRPTPPNPLLRQRRQSLHLAAAAAVAVAAAVVVVVVAAAAAAAVSSNCISVVEGPLCPFDYQIDLRHNFDKQHIPPSHVDASFINTTL